jgi:uncharacterized membrane protein
MGIGLLLAIVAAVVLVVLLVRLLSQTRVGGDGRLAPAPPVTHQTVTPAQTAPPAAHAETPREIVQRRYAAGEIDREEYLQKLADL